MFERLCRPRRGEYTKVNKNNMEGVSYLIDH